MPNKDFKLQGILNAGQFRELAPLETASAAELRAALSVMTARALSAESLSCELAATQIAERASRANVPQLPALKQSGVPLKGIPTLVLSDWRFGKVVCSGTVNGLNAYDVSAGVARASRIFATTLELLEPKPGRYDGMVVAIVGGLLYSVSCPLESSKAVSALVDSLVEGLISLAQHFPIVMVKGVLSGTASLASSQDRSNEELVYSLVEKYIKLQLGSRNNIGFEVSKSSDLQTTIYNQNYLLTCGLQYEQYSGHPLEKVHSGSLAKLCRNISVGLPAHGYTVTGHYGKYSSADNILINGSLVGYSEDDFLRNKTVERPLQAVFVTHPQYGITHKLAIFGENSPECADAYTPYVS